MVAQQQLLAGAGWPTYLLSNCSALHIDGVRQRYPFFQGFDGLCLSYEVLVRWMKACCAAAAAAVAVVGATTTATAAAAVHMPGREDRLLPVLLLAFAPPQPANPNTTAPHHCPSLLLVFLQVRSFKPEPEMYAAAEALAGLHGSDLLFIDDREENAAAAAERGWHAIHHTSPQDTLQRLRDLGLPVVSL